ncbi:MAG: hypothetical protein QGH76_03055 [Phycisphaerales bacterium]|jgi:uncharacterized protein YuzE|nr:hypothetical protein [Phycisphaerales bacterium]
MDSVVDQEAKQWQGRSCLGRERGPISWLQNAELTILDAFERHAWKQWPLNPAYGPGDDLGADQREAFLTTASSGIHVISGGTGGVEQHDLTDQIEADRYLNVKMAAKKKVIGIKITRAIQHGSIKRYPVPTTR